MKEGWEYKKLKEVGRTQTGTTPSKSVKSFYGGEIPFIRPAELDIDGNGSIEYNSELKLTSEGALKSRIIKANSTLMCCIGSVGKTGYTIKDVTCNQQINTITPYDGYNGKFVYYALLTPSFQKEVIKIANSAKATLAIISKGKWEEMYILVPPLSEQQGIVDYLDSAFAKIDAMKANAEKSLNEAKALFQASLKEMLEPKEGWEKKKFGDVCWYNKNNGIHKGTKYVGMEHIEQGTGTLIGTISSDDVLSNTFAFNKGDVLYGRLRPYLKKVIVADFDGCCSTEIFPIQSKSIIASFLKYWFLTDEITNKVDATCAGCRMPRGNMNGVLKFDISYPSLSEQQSIVATLDSLKSKVDRLQANFEKISQECDALKQAILRQVFE